MTDPRPEHASACEALEYLRKLTIAEREMIASWIENMDTKKKDENYG